MSSTFYQATKSTKASIKNKSMILLCLLLFINSCFASSSMHFTSPVSVMKVKDMDNINMIISELVDNMYHAFTHEAVTVETRDIAENNRFFLWQHNQGTLGNDADPHYLDFINSPELAELTKLRQIAAHRFIKNVSTRNITSIEKDLITGKDALVWASYHTSGSSHSVHTHADCLFSVVYYVTAPIGSGSIIFQDPRGPRAPFDEILRHNPEPGQFIIFPSFIAHAVETSILINNDNDTRRISLAWNLPGTWDDFLSIIE